MLLCLIYHHPIAMWDIIQEIRCSSTLTSSKDTSNSEQNEVNLNSIQLEYMYVGDAAGRLKTSKRSADFADSDLKLALNANIDFATPEKFFLSSNDPYHCVIQPHIILSRLSDAVSNIYSCRFFCCLM